MQRPTSLEVVLLFVLPALMIIAVAIPYSGIRLWDYLSLNGIDAYDACHVLGATLDCGTL